MKVLLTLWQLPQLILALIVMIATSAAYAFDMNSAKVYFWPYASGLSLGKYIFVPNDASTTMIKHEYGHTRQSVYLGWLYLIVIGLPSLVCCCLIGNKPSYYKFYTERWADKLGGVVRQ